MESVELTERQRSVLRALIAAYVGGGSPVGSKTISHLLPVNLSPASIRNTMAELSEKGLIAKSHASSGRVPTEEGLRFYVDRVLGEESELADYDKRRLKHSLEGVDAAEAIQVVSQLLSEHSHQMGFAVPPLLERVVLRYVSLVRLSAERLLVVLVSQSGEAYRRVIESPGGGDQVQLERVAAELNARVSGRTLHELCSLLESEIKRLKGQADRFLARALWLGLRAADAEDEVSPDPVFASRIALLEQPEFSDPERLRELLVALETKERISEVLGRVLEGDGVAVAMGTDFEEASLRHCALVAAPYRDERAAVGVVGVIGPNRMDYVRIIPLVSYCSKLVSVKMTA